MKVLIKHLQIHCAVWLRGRPARRLAKLGIAALLGWGPLTGLALGQSKPNDRPTPRTALTNVTFVAFDLETTGFSPDDDRIVEIGAVKFRNGEMVASTNWLVNPGRPVPFQAFRVHNISDDALKDQPPFEDVYPKFAAFIDGCVVMAHNARFDVSFISESLKRLDMDPPNNTVIDSLPVFRRWFPDATSHSLEGLAFHLNLRGDGFHRATADSAYIFLILKKGLRTRELRTLGELEKEAGSAGTLRF